MALQIRNEEPPKHEQTAAIAEPVAASNSVNSAVAAGAAEATVSAPSSEPEGGSHDPKQQLHAADVSVSGPTFLPSGTDVAGANTEAIAFNPPVAFIRVARGSPSSVDVRGMNAALMGGEEDEETSAAVLQGSDKATLGETLTISKDERCGSFSSTCDDTPLSRISHGSTCSWSVSGGVTFTSALNRHVDVQSPTLGARAGLVGDFLRSSCSGSSTSIGSTGTRSTLSDTTSSGGNMNLNDCDSSLKGVSSGSSDESHPGSSLYCSRAPSNTIKSSGIGECRGTSSSSETTRVSLDSTSYENNRISDSGGSSFEGRFTKEKAGPVKRSQQELMEDQREAGLLRPHEGLPFLSFPTRVRKHERGNSLDRCITYHGTTQNTTSGGDVEGTTQDDLLLSSNNITASPNGSSRRRSSSCAVSGKETRGKSRLVPGHLRLLQPDGGKEEEQQPQEGSRREEERWACGSDEAFRESAVERENASESYYCKRSSPGVGGGSPHTFAADSQVNLGSGFSTAAKQDLFTEEFEYIRKKSCLGLEHGVWSGRQRLSSSLNDSQRGDALIGGDLLFRNCCSSPRLDGGGGAGANNTGAGVGVLAGSLNVPERRSSSRQGSGIGGSSSGHSLLGVHKGGQQQHQANGSSNVLGRSLRDDDVSRSPGKAEIRTTKVSAGERGGPSGRGGGAERTSSGPKETVCKREDRWTSPFPGVKYCRSRNAWIARWSESGQEKWKTFPVKDSSFEEARRRALEFRQEKDRRKFERLWQQLNAEGLTTGNSGEVRNSLLSPGGSKLSGSDSSSGEGSNARNGVAGGRAVGKRNTILRKDMKSVSAWQQEQNEEGADDLLETPRLTSLGAFRTNGLLHDIQRQQQRRQDAQQGQQLQDSRRPEEVFCETLSAELISKGSSNTHRSAGCEGVDVLGKGRVWGTPGVCADACAPDGCGKDEERLSSGYFSDGWQQRNTVTTACLQLQGAQNACSAESTTSLLSTERGWFAMEDSVRRELAAAGFSEAATAARDVADTAGEKTEAPAISSNGPVHQPQRYSPVSGLPLATEAAATDGNEGIEGGRVVEALLRALSGEDAIMRKEGLCREKIALLLGEHGRMAADALARLPADEMPISRKRRSRDEDPVYTGSESTTAESVTPTSVKILSMYKAALLLIMDDLMSNGLPLLIASGGGAPFGTDYRHVPHTSAVAEGEVQLGDRKAMVEQSMRKMLEDQRRCIAEASLLGAVSPFVKLFETCILDQKLPSQADDSGRTQLVYLNALSALQELSLSVKGGSSIFW